jgi:hypothetical protein
VPEDAADAEGGRDAGLEVHVGRVVLDGETEKRLEVHSACLVLPLCHKRCEFVPTGAV